MKRNLKKVLSDILFQNTGSTTPILEAIMNKTVEVEIIQERIICDSDYSTQYNWGRFFGYASYNIKSWRY